MPKRFIRFNLPSDGDKKALFFNKERSNFLVIVEKRVFYLHKEFLSPSEFFTELIKENKNSVTINIHLNVDCFQKILGCFYGIEAALERHNIVPYILDILSLLRVKELNEQLKSDMRNNFDQYGLFNEFYLSRMFGLTDIEDRCIGELINQQFEQINYNKYDLFQLSPELFTFVLKQHEKLRANQQITGLGPKKIREVCEEYSKITNCTINVEQIFEYGKKFQQEFDMDSQEETPCIRKRNATWTSMPEKQDTIKKVKTQDGGMLSQQRIYSFEQKSNDLMKIKQINSSIQQKGSKLVAEIKSVRSAMDERKDKTIEDTPKSINDLNKKLKEFQEKSKNAHEKMQNLKQRMLQFHNQKCDSEKKQKNYDSQRKQKCDNANAEIIASKKSMYGSERKSKNVKNSIQLQTKISENQNGTAAKTLPHIAILNKNEDLGFDSDE